jgi:hypothetical protein
LDRTVIWDNPCAGEHPVDHYQENSQGARGNGSISLEGSLAGQMCVATAVIPKRE